MERFELTSFSNYDINNIGPNAWMVHPAAPSVDCHFEYWSSFCLYLKQCYGVESGEDVFIITANVTFLDQTNIHMSQIVQYKELSN